MGNDVPNPNQQGSAKNKAWHEPIANCGAIVLACFCGICHVEFCYGDALISTDQTLVSVQTAQPQHLRVIVLSHHPRVTFAGFKLREPKRTPKTALHCGVS